MWISLDFGRRNTTDNYLICLYIIDLQGSFRIPFPAPKNSKGYGIYAVTFFI